MKRVWILIVMGMMSMMTYAQEHHVLVAYFSATGTTAGVAKTLASVTGGDLFEIVPAQKYTYGRLRRDLSGISHLVGKSADDYPHIHRKL